MCFSVFTLFLPVAIKVHPCELLKIPAFSFDRGLIPLREFLCNQRSHVILIKLLYLVPDRPPPFFCKMGILDGKVIFIQN